MRTVTHIICLWLLTGALARADVTVNLATIQTLVATPTLAQVINNSVDTLAANTSRTWDYTAHNLDIQTNQNVWTWPVNMTWLGVCTNPVGGVNFQTILLTSNTILTCAHFSGAIGQNLNFRATNGVIWAATCTNDVNINGTDEEIGQLDHAIPPSVVPISVFPPTVTNYFLGHSLVGLNCIWCRRNGGSDTNNPYSSTIQYSFVQQVFGSIFSLNATGIGPFGLGYGATGGDSGSPGWVIIGNTPVILFATSSTYGLPGAYPGGGTGVFFSDPAQWTALAAAHLTNGLQILDLSGYRQYP
jgi:hypothetical protein